MESLRFLMVTTFYPPYHIGGDAVHVRYLAKALAEQGHEVHVEFAPSAYRLKGGRGPLPALDEDGITVHPIPSRLGRLQPIGAYLSGGSRSVSRTHAELMSRLRPDVVHLHNISLLGFGVLRSRSATTLYTAHDYWVRCPRSDLFKYGRYPCDAPTCLRCTLVSGKPPQLWRYREGWRGLRGVDLVIAPSRFMMQALEGYLNCPIVHIPNFAPDPNPGGRAWEPSDYYLYAGVYETHKGVLELAEAAGKNPTPWSVVLAGRGTLGNRLKRFEARADGRVKVHEWLAPDELARLYRSARAFVMPSLSWENSPLGAIEALSWGTPLLVSRRGGLEELLHAEPLAYLVVSHDRWFLERVAGRMVEINRMYPSGLFETAGRYSDFLARRDEAFIRPGLRTIFVSGYSEQPLLEGLLEILAVAQGTGRVPIAQALAWISWRPSRSERTCSRRGKTEFICSTAGNRTCYIL